MIPHSKITWPLAAAALAAIIGSGYAVTRHRSPRLSGTPNDSLALADSAYRACGRLQGDARQSCYERLLVPLVRSRGVRLAMGTLNRIGELDAAVKNDGHVYAHAIGIEAGKAGGDVGTSFAACTEIFQSGCYHGVIQAYFETVSNVDTQNVNALCQSYTAPDADRWLRFQCVHGMGHGLTMFYTHDLPLALRGCDLLGDDWDRESCYGGAFMENVVNATSPHHPAAQLRVGPGARDTAAAGHDHGGGHDHGAANTGRGGEAAVQGPRPRRPTVSLLHRRVALLARLLPDADLGHAPLQPGRHGRRRAPLRSGPGLDALRVPPEPGPRHQRLVPPGAYRSHPHVLAGRHGVPAVVSRRRGEEPHRPDGAARRRDPLLRGPAEPAQQAQVLRGGGRADRHAAQHFGRS